MSESLSLSLYFLPRPKETTVTTPVGENYDGVVFAPKLCGVSVIRSGEAMENALRTCCMGVKIGKILIHRSGDRCQELAYEKVPHDISERHVLLMDPILATGESAVRAIEVPRALLGWACCVDCFVRERVVVDGGGGECSCLVGSCLVQTGMVWVVW